MNSFPDLIETWPSLGDFAADVNVPYVRAQLWKHRRSIPPQYWDDVVKAAQGRGYKHITLGTLTQLAKAKRKAA